MALTVILAVIFAIAGIFLQIGVFPGLGATTVAPFMALASTVSISLFFGPLAGLLTGFFGGLVIDLLTGWGLGLLAFPLAVMGFLSGTFKGKANSRHFLYAMIFAFTAHIICDTWVVLVFYFSRIPAPVSIGAVWRTLLSALSTSIAAGILHIVCGISYARSARRRERNMYLRI